MTITFNQVRRQISGDPCDRRVKRASSAQLDYLARLILECEGKQGFRWDYVQPEVFTAKRAADMIGSLQRFSRKDAA